MVFVLKYRKGLITDEIFNYFKHIFSGISERYYLNFQAMGVERNHLHILVEAAPRYSPSRVLENLRNAPMLCIGWDSRF